MQLFCLWRTERGLQEVCGVLIFSQPLTLSSDFVVFPFTFPFAYLLTGTYEQWAVRPPYWISKNLLVLESFLCLLPFWFKEKHLSRPTGQGVMERASLRKPGKCPEARWLNRIKQWPIQFIWDNNICQMNHFTGWPDSSPAFTYLEISPLVANRSHTT